MAQGYTSAVGADQLAARLQGVDCVGQPAVGDDTAVNYNVVVAGFGFGEKLAEIVGGSP